MEKEAIMAGLLKPALGFSTLAWTSMALYSGYKSGYYAFEAIQGDMESVGPAAQHLGSAAFSGVLAALSGRAFRSVVNRG